MALDQEVNGHGDVASRNRVMSAVVSLNSIGANPLRGVAPSLAELSFFQALRLELNTQAHAK